jgi:UDPglucose 6-dehydrogenase
LVDKIKKYYNNELKGKKFAIWGLAFKPETDDVREAPALYIIDELLRELAIISVFDPEAMENVRRLFGDKIVYASEQYSALEDADALIIATEWSVFRTPDFEKLKTLLKSKVIFDGRNLYDLQKMKDEGFFYNSIGRKIIDNES